MYLNICICAYLAVGNTDLAVGDGPCGRKTDLAVGKIDLAVGKTDLAVLCGHSLGPDLAVGKTETHESIKYVGHSLGPDLTIGKMPVQVKSLLLCQG
jgi:hypothetical protein